MTEPLSDEELMLRYRDGDATAFETLYARHKAPLYRYFLRLARPSAVAEELFQDVWTNLVRVRGSYEVRAKFSTWLYRMAHNRLVDHYRRAGSSAVGSFTASDTELLEAVPDAPWREPANELDRRRLAYRILGALAELPEAQREAFLLREEAGLSLEEIATTTGVAVETAKSRVRYAMAKLRRHLATDAPAGSANAAEN